MTPGAPSSSAEVSSTAVLRALVVGTPPGRSPAVGVLRRLGYACTETDDPYSASTELTARGAAYGLLAVSLNSLYREELAFVAVAVARYPQLVVYVCDADGRLPFLAEAMRLGAVGVLSAEGLHAATGPTTAVGTGDEPGEYGGDEPLLTADELRALLHDPPPPPPSRRNGR